MNTLIQSIIIEILEGLHLFLTGILIWEQNPIYNAERIKFSPNFSFAVGDSIQKRDHLIRNVFNNNIAFYKNKFPVEIDVASYKFNNEEITVRIEHNKKIIATKKVKYSNSDQDFKKLIFNLPAEKIGFQTYTVHLEELQNEVSLQNNHRNFYVEILDSRNKVLILSDAPHPDVAALQSVLSEDDNIEVEYKTFEAWDKKVNNINLLYVIILQNYLVQNYFSCLKISLFCMYWVQRHIKAFILS